VTTNKLDALGRQLKGARPLLVTRVTPGEWTPEGRAYQLDPWHLDHPLEWDELDREGYDPTGGTGLGPVYYRVIRIGGEWFYLSTAQVPRGRTEGTGKGRCGSVEEGWQDCSDHDAAATTHHAGMLQ